MGILVANDGSRFVNTIAERDSIVSRFNGMRVVVNDATGDVAFGSGKVHYTWDAVTTTWTPVWSSVKSELSFTTEEKVLSGGKVTAEQIVKDGQVWTAKVLDVNDVVLSDAKVTVIGKELDIGTTSMDGNKLRYTYAYGNLVTELLNIWDSKAPLNDPLFTGNPRVPLVVVGDESASAASTQFVGDTLRSAGFEPEGAVWKNPVVVFDRYTLKLVATTDVLDLAVQQVFTVDAASNRTLTFSNGPGAGRAMTIVVKVQGNTGTITWPAGISWNSDLAPTLGDSFTVVVLFWDGSSWTGAVGSSA